MNKSKISSVQFMLTLFILGLSVVLFQKYNNALTSSFFVNLILIASSVIIAIIYYTPSGIIRSKTGMDLISFSQSLPVGVRYFSAIVYSIYFVWITVYVLISYCDMFVRVINPSAWKYAIAFLVLAAGIYSACKGLEGTTRCGIFFFAFAVIALLIIFCGNISKFDFEVNNPILNDYKGSVVNSVSEFMQFGFTALIFGVLAGRTKNFKVKHYMFLMIMLAVVAMSAVFFIWFVLGRYGANADYQMYSLSKASEIMSSGGIDSIFLVLTTIIIFLFVAIGLICTARSAGAEGCNYLKISFGVIVFVLFVCAEKYRYTKEILTSPMLFNIFTLITAVVLPIIYIVVFRRKLIE